MSGRYSRRRFVSLPWVDRRDHVANVTAVRAAGRQLFLLGARQKVSAFHFHVFLVVLRHCVVHKHIYSINRVSKGISLNRCTRRTFDRALSRPRRLETASSGDRSGLEAVLDLGLELLELIPSDGAHVEKGGGIIGYHIGLHACV